MMTVQQVFCFVRSVAVLLGFSLGIISHAHDALAFGRAAPDYSSGYVTAESRIGNGHVTAEVRPGSRGGYEYRVPGGSWRDCEGDCAVTITNKVLDFWDNQANRGYPGRGITFGIPTY